MVQRNKKQGIVDINNSAEAMDALDQCLHQVKSDVFTDDKRKAKSFPKFKQTNVPEGLDCQRQHRPSVISFFVKVKLPGSIAAFSADLLALTALRSAAPLHAIPPMNQGGNPPDLGAEAFDEVVLDVSKYPDDLLQLIFDKADPDNPVVSAARAMNNRG